MNDKKTVFEEAIEATLFWCNTWEKSELSDEVLADKITKLLETKEGARGFFAISLSSDCHLMDRIPESILFQLREAGQIVVDLTAKNLAMSSAMEVHHHRKKNFKQKCQSERIKRRCIELIRELDTKLVKKRVEMIINGTKGIGEDSEFLQRWGYDDEQKLAIYSSFNSIAED